MRFYSEIAHELLQAAVPIYEFTIDLIRLCSLPATQNMISVAILLPFVFHMGFVALVFSDSGATTAMSDGKEKTKPGHKI